MRKKTAKQYLEAQGFEEVKDLPRRGRNLMDAEEIKTLAINSSGRVSIPINVLKHYDLECTYFNISFNSKKLSDSKIKKRAKSLPLMLLSGLN